MLAMHCISHRPVEPPDSDIGILQVGNQESDFGHHRDNQGDNIASLNHRFSELTGLYYVWKNLPSPTVGFCHYRRYLIPTELSPWLREAAEKPYHENSKGGVANYASGFLLSQDKLREKLSNSNYTQMITDQLQDADILLPKSNKLPVGGFLKQYGNAHPIHPFFECLALMGQRDNRLAQDAHHFFTQFPHAHWNNLFVTSWDHYCDYCEFVFELLIALNQKIPTLKDAYQNRICAFLSERLFNFWIYNRGLKIIELDWCMTEEVSSTVESHQRKRSSHSIKCDAE